MGSRVSTCVRLSGVALLMALTACGGGGGGEPGEPGAPAAPPPPASQLLDWDDHPAASTVLGQAGMDRSDRGDLDSATGSPAVTAGGGLYVVSGEAVKEFDNYAAGGVTAQRTHSINGGASDIYVHGSKIVVANEDGVFIYNNGFKENADVYSSRIVGCSREGMNAPQSSFITSAGDLIVADTFNNRVLIWNRDIMPASGPLPEPSVVVGQRNLDTCSANDGGEPSEFTLDRPLAVWSDGTRLVVADSGNNRLLIWNSLPRQDFQPADHVVGQADFIGRNENRGGAASEFTLCGPRSVDVNAAGQMAVADSCNHRVLVWDAVPRSDSVPANHVLGQNTFADNNQPTAPTAQNLSSPTGARFHDRSLIVVDNGHNRVLVFPASN